MAKDSVFNAAAVLRALAGIDLADYDLHVNVIGGGNIDGPSAGLAVFLATYSALTKKALPQNIAVTGEVSIQGRVRPVGGVVEKLYAARQAGMRAVIIPKENARELDRRHARSRRDPRLDRAGSARSVRTRRACARGAQCGSRATCGEPEADERRRRRSHPAPES